VRRSTAPRSVRDWILAGLGALYLVMWVGGIGTYVIFGGVRAGDEWTAPLFLALAGLIVLAGVSGARRPVLIIAGVLGFTAEWIGLRTGQLFGDYRYTNVLAPALLDVPLVMVSAWLVLVAYVDDLLLAGRAGRLARVVGGAAILTAIDLIIDPLAAGPLGYWMWLHGGIYYDVPLHNFAGWFIVGAMILSLVQLVPARAPSSSTLWTGLSIVLFFTVLAAANGMVVPALVGLCLCGLHAYIRRTAAARVTG
jgi:bisanhydrobacterioruberin hydratase